MNFPNKIYQCKINGIIFINLFIIPNKNRLREIMNSNNMNLTENENEDFSWFTSDQETIKKSLTFVSTELGIFYENNLQTTEQVRAFLREYGYNFKSVEEIHELGKGGESLVLRLLPY